MLPPYNSDGSCTPSTSATITPTINWPSAASTDHLFRREVICSEPPITYFDRIDHRSTTPITYTDTQPYEEFWVPITTDGFANDWFPGLTKGWIPHDSKKRLLTNKIKKQLSLGPPQNHRGVMPRANRPVFTSVSTAELKALSLLKTMLQDYEWKKYLKYGFVTITAQSHLTYQIPRHGHIKVFKRGNIIAELCINFKNIPPSDKILSLKLMIEHQESDVWKKSNIHFPKGFLANAMRKDHKNINSETLIRLYLE